MFVMFRFREIIMPGIQFLDFVFVFWRSSGRRRIHRASTKVRFFDFPIVVDFFLCFSNCNRLVSEVTFTLFSLGSNNESGLTLDCSFRFSTKRERGEREGEGGRQTNSLKGQILAVGERSQPFPICPYFRLRQLHITFNF